MLIGYGMKQEHHFIQSEYSVCHRALGIHIDQERVRKVPHKTFMLPSIF